MATLINVHDGSQECPSIAFVRQNNVGIAPSATYSTIYAIHDKIRREGYVGFFDNGAIEHQQPEVIKERLQTELQPAIGDMSRRHSALEILVAGTEIRGTGEYLAMEESAISEYERDVRRAIAQAFAKNFLIANITLRFNNYVGSSNCLIYIPRLDFIEVFTDTGSWSGIL